MPGLLSDREIKMCHAAYRKRVEKLERARELEGYALTLRKKAEQLREQAKRATVRRLAEEFGCGRSTICKALRLDESLRKEVNNDKTRCKQAGE